jgi:hypothetical protein
MAVEKTPNTYTIQGGIVTLAIGDRCTVFDECDFEAVSKLQWHFINTGYVVSSHGILLHRLIAATPDGMDTDHIDRDKTNNRRGNLRHATRSENMYNAGPRKDNTSGYRGVHWHPQTGKWRVRIWANKKCIHVGLFSNKSDAIAAHKAAVTELHGDFAGRV